jgi:hypothetical protein
VLALSLALKPIAHKSSPKLRDSSLAPALVSLDDIEMNDLCNALEGWHLTKSRQVVVEVEVAPALTSNTIMDMSVRCNAFEGQHLAQPRKVVVEAEVAPVLTSKTVIDMSVLCDAFQPWYLSKPRKFVAKVEVATENNDQDALGKPSTTPLPFLFSASISAQSPQYFIVDLLHPVVP